LNEFRIADVQIGATDSTVRHDMKNRQARGHGPVGKARQVLQLSKYSMDIALKVHRILCDALTGRLVFVESRTQGVALG